LGEIYADSKLCALATLDREQQQSRNTKERGDTARLRHDHCVVNDVRDIEVKARESIEAIGINRA